MKKFLVAAILAASIVLMGCATITVPTGVTNEPVGPLVGQSSGRIWLGVFGTADAGVRAAAENGGITVISTVDTTTSLGFLGLWMDFETTVTGR